MDKTTTLGNRLVCLAEKTNHGLDRSILKNRVNIISFSALVLLVVLMASCSSRGTGYNITGDTLHLEGKWQFTTGDNMNWLNEPVVPWKEIDAAKSIDEQGFSDYDGIAWYRKTLVIPSSMKDLIDPKYNGLFVILGKIDDADQTWINGKQIGATGDMADASKREIDVTRKYFIPESLIKWDEENIIAVRMRDFGGRGGMFEGAQFIVAAKNIDFISCRPVIDGDNGIYKLGEPARPSLLVVNKSKVKVKGTIICTTYSDLHEMRQVQKKTFEIQPGDSALTSFLFRADVAGFYESKMSVRIVKSEVTFDKSVYFGFDPAKIEAGLSRPADFEQYWNQAKKELLAVKPEFKATRVDSLCTAKVDVYLVEMKSLGNVTIRGWYSAPVKKGKYPAILQVQGLSAVQHAVTDYPDFAFFCLNIRGHGNSRDQINPGFPGFLVYNINDKNQYIYRGAYMDCIRAVDFLCSRPEVDTKRIAVQGESQGGALSFATAALDKRIKLCAPDVPFLSDFRHYFRMVNWPASEFNAYVEKNPGTTLDQVYAVLDYIDIKNLAPWITCPTLMGVGLRDQTCPPYINFAAFNNIKTSNKEWHIYTNQGHAVSAEHYALKHEWIRKHFNVQ